MSQPFPRAVVRLLAALAMVVATGTAGALPARADTYYPIKGSGSTWSENAVRQWASDVNAAGIGVTYSGNGSSAGRSEFLQGITDFGISEIPFQTRPTDGSLPEPVSNRPYAYMPIVAGGTSFMYNLKVGGRTIRDLRLSGETITKIFTRRITSWADPQITHEYGSQLPPIDIRPVVRSDGSGTTAQFTLWMDKQYPALWRGFFPSGGLTSIYPSAPGIIAQNLSTGQAGFVASPTNGNGTIAYLEYSYAQSAAGGPFPVVQLLNKAGYYTEPTQYNVAVALTKAQINTRDPRSPDYLTQILDGVYSNPDPRAYPLSSYSYMILPTSLSGSMTPEKGKTLSAFANYFLCQGQTKAGLLGYSPMPYNLVNAAFDQVKRVPGYVPNPREITSCANPTFDGRDLSKNRLAEIAPQPNSCQRQDQPRCGTGQAATEPGTGGQKSVPGGGPATSPAGPGTPGAPATNPGAPATNPGAPGSSPGGGTGSGPGRGGSNPAGGGAPGPGSPGAANPGAGAAAGAAGSTAGRTATGQQTSSGGTRPSGQVPAGGGTAARTPGRSGTGTASGSAARSPAGAGDGNTPGATARVPGSAGVGGPSASVGAAGATPAGGPVDEAGGVVAPALNGQVPMAGDQLAAVPVTLGQQRENGALSPLLGGLAALELLLAAALPPIVVGLLRRRRAGRSS